MKEATSIEYKSKLGLLIKALTLSVPVTYHHPTSPYKTLQNKSFGHEKMRIDQTKETTED